MGKFQVIKRLSLASLGEGWSQAYLKFTAASFGEQVDNIVEDVEKMSDKEAAQKAIEFVSKHFVEGKGFNGQEAIDIVAEDLRELPAEIIKEAVDLIRGDLSPNS